MFGLTRFETIVLLSACFAWAIIDVFAVRFFGQRGYYIWGIIALPWGYVVGEHLRRRRKKLWVMHWRSTHPGVSDEFMPERLGKK
jgi:hypothetical protein